jgi:hypothetical protein
MITRTKIETVIGKGFADSLDAPIFQVNEWRYTRRQMVELLDCANFIAAARLAKVLKRLKIESAAQLNKMDPYSLARTRGIGNACIFVAMCILDAGGYDVLKWWNYKDNVVKFQTFKHKAIQRASRRKHEVA